jgi:hypothetical protein
MTTALITPQTHPELYRPITVGPYAYHARFFTAGISVGLREAVNEAYHQEFLRCTGEPEFDSVKYNAWLETREGKYRTDIVAMHVLLIPGEGAPEFSDELMEWLMPDDMSRVVGFFEPDFGNRKNEPTPSIASS